MTYPTFVLTQQDYRDAEQHELKMRERRGLSPIKAYVVEKPNLIGFLGELAMERYLLAREIAFSKPPEHTGRCGDKYDFKIGQSKIDVKTTMKYDEILIDEHSALKAIDNNVWLVLARMIENRIELRGYQHANELVRAKDKDFIFDNYVRKMYRIAEKNLKRFKNFITINYE